MKDADSKDIKVFVKFSGNSILKFWLKFCNCVGDTQFRGCYIVKISPTQRQTQTWKGGLYNICMFYTTSMFSSQEIDSVFFVLNDFKALQSELFSFKIHNLWFISIQNKSLIPWPSHSFIDLLLLSWLLSWPPSSDLQFDISMTLSELCDCIS